MSYSLKSFNKVREHFIFKKRHSAITMVLVIVMILNTINATLIIIFDHILLKWMRFSIVSIILYQQYMSIFILILFTVSLKVYLSFYDINYSQTIINNEWKSLIDPTIADGDINWYIKHKNTIGNSKYWIKYLVLIYALSLISTYSLEAWLCWSPNNYSKCYFYLDSFEYFQYRQIVANYENSVAVIFALIAWLITIIIRFRTNSFEDNFHIRMEIQLLLISSLAILFNIPHAYVCYAIEHKKYKQLLGTTNHENIENIWCISAILTITQYQAWSVYGTYILTIWTIKKNKHWLKLFENEIGNTSINTTISARTSFHLDPLHRKVSDVALSTFNLSTINDEHTIPEKSISSLSHKSATNNDKNNKIELDKILKTEEGFTSFMYHLSTEFSIEVLISLIEFYQYKYYIQSVLSQNEDTYFGENNNNNDKIQDILKKSNKMIPQSHIIKINNFENEEFAIKYKLEYANYIGMVYKKNTQLKEYDDPTKYKLLFECMIMSYEIFNKYINIGCLAEININYFVRQELIDIYDDMEIGDFIEYHINEKLINGNSNIDEEIEFYYHIFDDCCEEMIKLMGYSFSRFCQTSLFQKVIDDKL